MMDYWLVLAMLAIRGQKPRKDLPDQTCAQRRGDDEIPVNAKCPCESGKKFKKCCGRILGTNRPGPRPPARTIFAGDEPAPPETTP